jgi:hypothetical protein
MNTWRLKEMATIEDIYENLYKSDEDVLGSNDKKTSIESQTLVIQDIKEKQKKFFGIQKKILLAQRNNIPVKFMGCSNGTRYDIKISVEESPKKPKVFVTFGYRLRDEVRSRMIVETNKVLDQEDLEEKQKDSANNLNIYEAFSLAEKIIEERIKEHEEYLNWLQSEAKE